MGGVVRDSYASDKEIQLTVNADSVEFSNGQLLYLIHRDRGQIRLIDANKKPLLILNRKMLSIRRRWEGFAGRELDGGHGSKPIFSVRRSSMIGRSNLSAEVYGNVIAGKFRVKGSFEERRFTVYDIGNRSVGAEIWRDVVGGGGEDPVILRVVPGFDSAFAVALVVVLEQIGGGGI